MGVLNDVFFSSFSSLRYYEVLNQVQPTDLDHEDGTPAHTVSWARQNIAKHLPMWSGPSSTTSMMVEIARILNLPKGGGGPMFQLLMSVWMIQPRDHSFVEIMGAFDAYVSWVSCDNVTPPCILCR